MRPIPYNPQAQSLAQGLPPPSPSKEAQARMQTYRALCVCPNQDSHAIPSKPAPAGQIPNLQVCHGLRFKLGLLNSFISSPTCPTVCGSPPKPHLRTHAGAHLHRCKHGQPQAVRSTEAKGPQFTGFRVPGFREGWRPWDLF